MSLVFFPRGVRWPQLATRISALGNAAKQTGLDLGAIHAGLRGMAKFTAQVVAGKKTAIKTLE